MKCNCNKAGADIKVVQGNMLRIAIPLTLRTVEVVNGVVEATDTDFVPSSEHPVTVVFTRKGVRLRFDAVMQGNVAYIEDRGTIPVGTYDITVCCKDDNGNPYRFKQNTVLSVKDATAEAGIVSPIDYELKTWYLNAAIYLVPTSPGGGGVSNETDPVFSASPASNIRQSDINNWNGKVNPSALAPVATSGSYNDLSNKPTIPSVQDVLEELPTFADVATTGDYSDLENTPNLATVATSGSYNDLTDKPTIPEGADLTGYATEQYVNTAIAGLVDSSPTTLDTLNELAAALGDDPNFATTMTTALGNKVDKETGKSLMTDAERTKLSGIATGAEVNVNADWNASSGDAQILNKPNLATVATSGSYNDLSNKPTIPAAVTVDSSLTGSSQTNPVQGGAIYSALEGKEDRQVEIINMYYDYDGGELTWTNSSGDSMTTVQVNTLLRNSSKNVIIKATFDDIGDVDGTRLYYRASSIDDNYILFYALEYNMIYWLGLDADLSDYSYLFLDDKGVANISNYVPTTRTVNGKTLSSDITLTASDVGAQSTISDLATIRSGAAAGATALQPSDVSVETPSTPDGTVDINVGSDTYTINLNHTHEGMAKLVVCDESELPSTLETDTIYGVEEDGEISVLYVGGIPFYGGGGGTAPVLRQPSDGSTIDVGLIASGQSSVTKTITIKGKNLTQALTVAVTGTGYSVNKQTISAADANAGTTLTITCTSTADEAAGTLSFASSEVSCDCDLIANVPTYEALRGVKFTGSQWLQTDYKPNANTEFVLTCRFEQRSDTQSTSKDNYEGNIFSVTAGSSDKWFYLRNMPATSDNAYNPWNLMFVNESSVNYGNDNQIIGLGGNASTRPYLLVDPVEIYYSKGTSEGTIGFTDGTHTMTKQTSLKSSTQENAMMIGHTYNASNGKDKIYSVWNLTIYSFVITEGGNEVRHWVPRLKNGTIAGLYDTVNNTFISSETSTELVAVPLT